MRIFWSSLFLITLATIGAIYLPFRTPLDLPPVEFRDLQVEFRSERASKISTLSPPVAVISKIELRNSLGQKQLYDVEKGILVQGDREWIGPLIIKVNHLKYLIYDQGAIRLKYIMKGGEGLFDALFRIQKPPDPPKSGDTNDWEPDDEKPDRFKWKPDGR